MTTTPNDLLRLARAALRPCAKRADLGCPSCSAKAALENECTPARIVALCERLERLRHEAGDSAVCGCSHAIVHPMTTDLDREAPGAKR